MKRRVRDTLITCVALLVAATGWWSLYELAGRVAPDQAGAIEFFFALLFLAVTATLIPAAAYLNRRFAPVATAQDPWRFFRHGAWGGVSVVVWAWLQMHRSFHVGFALVIILMFVVLEVLIARLRGDQPGRTG
ncbi:MAG: hypothetical protein JXA93_18920 [Anaerolineae bacterium]|nr:hypothetical protein [Anaerolineae bacterium]